jgi:D-xylose transport system substrate-binding protein
LENLISQGAQVLIVLAQDGTAIKPAVESAIGQGVPVIAYDRLIEDPQALYITFDNKGVGRLEAEEIFKRVPKGRYVIVKGSSTDANADFLREGFEEVIGAAVAAGDIEIVSETYTDNWDPANAQATMEQVLSAEDNKVDAVLAQNDGMAGGVIAALEAQGLAGKVPVSGQDAEQAALLLAPSRSPSGRTRVSSASQLVSRHSHSVRMQMPRLSPALRRSPRLVATPSPRSSSPRSRSLRTT